MNKTDGNANSQLDQVPEHLLASVKGLNSVIAGAPFCYGVNNDVPGPAQNRIGPCGRLSLDRGNMRKKIEKAQKSENLSVNSQASKLLELEGSNPPIRRGDT